MLTIEQLPVAIKDRVIELINRDGMSAQTVRSCCYGLAYANSGANGRNEAPRRRHCKSDLPEIIGKISEDVKKNKREYVRQVMTIYGMFMANVMLDELQLAGIEIPQERLQELQTSSEALVLETVEKHLDGLVNELDK